ncbi:MAG: hypothetical protein AAF391_00200 [Bacteroidota bacterium]
MKPTIEELYPEQSPEMQKKIEKTLKRYAALIVRIYLRKLEEGNSDSIPLSEESSE